MRKYQQAIRAEGQAKGLEGILKDFAYQPNEVSRMGQIVRKMREELDFDEYLSDQIREANYLAMKRQRKEVGE